MVGTGLSTPARRLRYEIQDAVIDPPTPLCPSPCLSLMEMTRSHAGDCLIRRSPPTCAPITRLMRSFMWSFGSIPSTQTLSSSGVAPASGFTASLLYLRSICSSNDGFYETEGGRNRRINHVKSHSCCCLHVCFQNECLKRVRGPCGREACKFVRRLETFEARSQRREGNGH